MTDLILCGGCFDYGIFSAVFEVVVEIPIEFLLCCLLHTILFKNLSKTHLRKRKILMDFRGLLEIFFAIFDILNREKKGMIHREDTYIGR